MNKLCSKDRTTSFIPAEPKQRRPFDQFETHEHNSYSTQNFTTFKTTTITAIVDQQDHATNEPPSNTFLIDVNERRKQPLVCGVYVFLGFAKFYILCVMIFSDSYNNKTN